MTRYINKSKCKHCGEPHWFRYWVGKHCDRSTAGLCVGDFDLTFHRFSLWGNRTIEHLMVVEVKTGEEPMHAAQEDTLSVFNAAMEKIIPVDGEPLLINSRPGYIRKGKKKVVWHGIHVLRVPFNESENGPFYWDGQEIEPVILAKVLSFKHDPCRPQKKLDVDRPHKKKRRIIYRRLFD